MSPVQRLFIATHVRLFRLTGGKFGGSMRGGKILLLTTKGRKTGQPRTVPAMYMEDGAGHPVVCASAAGAPNNPAWFENLKANPDVRIQLGAKEVPARAEIAAPEVREQLWTQLTTKFPGFLDYTKKTTRKFPMVILKPS